MFNICLVYLFHPFIFNLSLSLCLGALSRLLLIFKKFVHFGFICHLVWWLCLLIGEFNSFMNLIINMFVFISSILSCSICYRFCLFVCMCASLPHPTSSLPSIGWVKFIFISFFIYFFGSYTFYFKYFNVYLKNFSIYPLCKV